MKEIKDRVETLLISSGISVRELEDIIASSGDAVNALYDISAQLESVQLPRNLVYFVAKCNSMIKDLKYFSEIGESGVDVESIELALAEKD